MKEEMSKAQPTEKKMMVVRLDWLTPHHGNTWDERP
jgi:hypothetical protein